MNKPDLAGKVVLITGASRGIGKGIALALASRGATVYVTGRTISDGDHILPGSISATAEECNERGGKGIAVKLDIQDEAQLAAVFQQIQDEQGRLDVLVNNAMAIPDAMTQKVGFWEKPLSTLDILDTGLRSAYIAAWHAANIMVKQGSGLIVSLSGYVGVTYTYDVLFGTTKSGVDRMARDMAIELKPHNVTSLSLWQGFTYTERAIENLKKVPGMAAQLNSAVGSSPEFPGLVIAALLADPNLLEKTGGTFINAELAHLYGITDVDGRVIPSLRDERGAPIWTAV
jgi:NAD(P)-dependent dehydrogenase (short-subunit alcohol dehydrogenase family)